VKNQFNSNQKYSETNISKMFDILIDNILVFGGCVFKQRVSIPIGTNCTPILADLYFYLYEADFIQEFLQRKENKLDQSFYKQLVLYI